MRQIEEAEAQAMPRTERADPRQAAMRTAPAPTAGNRLRRRRYSEDPLQLDALARLAPPGWTYEWKREEVYNRRETAHQNNLRLNHWTNVPADRHPELAAPGETVIRQPGMILMMRPSYLTEEARLEDLEMALDKLRSHEEVLRAAPNGQLTRNHPSLANKTFVRQSYEGPDPALTAEP